MSLFRKLFGAGPADIRDQLRSTYLSSFRQMGISEGQARKLVDSLLDKAEARSREQGTSSYLLNYGDVLLEKQQTDESARTLVEELHAEGVRDEDIRWWWNMHDLERCMLIENDEMSRLVLFNKEVTEGRSSEQAAAKVRSHFPIFGKSISTVAGETVEDRPLPYELKDRINRFVEVPANQSHMRSISHSYSSMNAYIRSRLRSGGL